MSLSLIFTTVKGGCLYHILQMPNIAHALDEALSDLTDSDESDHDKDHIAYSERDSSSGDESEVLLPQCCHYAQLRDF